MQSISQSELKIFFNIQGLCLIGAMIFLLFTDLPIIDIGPPVLTGSLPFIFVSLIAIISFVQLFINLQSNYRIFKFGILAYALLTASLLGFFLTS